MLQMMDMSANGYRETATQREHFPVHMLSQTVGVTPIPSESGLKSVLLREVPLETNLREEGVFEYGE